MWSIIWWQWKPMDIRLLVLSKQRSDRNYTKLSCPKEWYWSLGTLLFFHVCILLNLNFKWHFTFHFIHFFSIIVTKKVVYQLIFWICWMWQLKYHSLVLFDHWMWPQPLQYLCGNIVNSISSSPPPIQVPAMIVDWWI